MMNATNRGITLPEKMSTGTGSLEYLDHMTVICPCVLSINLTKLGLDHPWGRGFIVVKMWYLTPHRARGGGDKRGTYYYTSIWDKWELTPFALWNI